MQSHNLWPLRLGRHFPAVSKLWQGSPGKSRGRARRPEPPAVRTPRSIHVLTLSPAASTTGTRWHTLAPKRTRFLGGFPVGRDSVGFRTGRIADGARGESPRRREERGGPRENRTHLRRRHGRGHLDGHALGGALPGNLKADPLPPREERGDPREQGRQEDSGQQAGPRRGNRGRPGVVTSGERSRIVSGGPPNI